MTIGAGKVGASVGARMQEVGTRLLERYYRAKQEEEDEKRRRSIFSYHFTYEKPIVIKRQRKPLPKYIRTPLDPPPLKSHSSIDKMIGLHPTVEPSYDNTGELFDEYNLHDVFGCPESEHNTFIRLCADAMGTPKSLDYIPTFETSNMQKRIYRKGL